jgi:hypothetical protein
MRKIKTLSLSPYNHTLGIYNANLDVREVYHEYTDQTMTQGFSRRPGSYNFYPLTECMSLSIEAWLADPQDEVVVNPRTVRAIMVPYSVSKSGIMVLDLLGVVEELIPIPEGDYALVFEIWPEDEQEEAGLSSEQEYSIGFLNEACLLTFYPRSTPVMPEILRVDRWTSPPNLDTYWPLNPVYPLVMEVGLA